VDVQEEEHESRREEVLGVPQAPTAEGDAAPVGGGCTAWPGHSAVHSVVKVFRGTAGNRQNPTASSPPCGARVGCDYPKVKQAQTFLAKSPWFRFFP